MFPSVEPGNIIKNIISFFPRKQTNIFKTVTYTFLLFKSGNINGRFNFRIFFICKNYLILIR